MLFLLLRNINSSLERMTFHINKPISVFVSRIPEQTNTREDVEKGTSADVGGVGKIGYNLLKLWRILTLVEMSSAFTDP